MLAKEVGTEADPQRFLPPEKVVKEMSVTVDIPSPLLLSLKNTGQIPTFLPVL
jgi:hypothetical protein